ncbi:hypothetical protein HY636_00115 [Candidatus Woesearchaeota archaeon]|nr:hypothetical protein [Candidatus Woesearchaeota archaeon]
MLPTISSETIREKIEKGILNCLNSCDYDLHTGDRVIMSVGTYCGYVTNDDWRFVEGYVGKIIPSNRAHPVTRERIDYNIIRLVPYKPASNVSADISQKETISERIKRVLGISPNLSKETEKGLQDGLTIDTDKGLSFGMIYRYCRS